ncbi:hypothetical protein AC578_6849 [Pseudocercospora eumusae]|uniref:BTB domain-containing protein n=1 Tax=Pseudocercospora eumusae TaxID=321146 RepID=A0A139H790_9PEZI|nr:hypothetical protein AC578_6849 [Pseudocercospora eumusae]KXS98318.1 hypothetical protein AC578_6849 [Pseudocercospora eumusae]
MSTRDLATLRESPMLARRLETLNYPSLHCKNIAQIQTSCAATLPKLRSIMPIPLDFGHGVTARALRTELRASYNDALFSDLIVKCQGIERRVHKSMVCKHSKWFAQACAGDFNEGKSQTIELHEDDPEIIDAMLRSCYAFEFDAGGSYLRAVKIFAAAEKYMMENLQHTAAAAFYYLFHPSLWQSLASGAEDSIKEHAAAISEAYTTSSDPDKILRNVILRCATLKHRHCRVGISDTSGYREIAKSHPEFGVDLAVRLAQTGPVLVPFRNPRWDTAP